MLLPTFFHRGEAETVSVRTWLTRPLRRYAHWLHLQWPAGTVEKMPDVREDFTTNVAGLFVVGDLTGVPLLKMAADSGARVVRRIAREIEDERRSGDGVLDLVVVGGGVAGMAAALEARELGLRFEVFEAVQPFATVADFPDGKPIFAYPEDFEPAGGLRFGEGTEVKEGLLEALRRQTLERGVVPRIARVDRVERAGGALRVVLASGESVAARRVVVAIGRSGNFRKLGVPGEDLTKVHHRLHDPKDYCDLDVLVVGGGDSAAEAAIALASCGARVTLSYRRDELTRPKAENQERLRRLARDPGARVSLLHPTSERVTTAVGPFVGESSARGRLELALGTTVREIRERAVVLVDRDGRERTLANDAVFVLIGREPPLDFFRRSGVRIRGERTWSSWLSFAAFFTFCLFLYHWKSDSGFGLKSLFHERGWFPFLLPRPGDPSTIAGTLRISAREPSFWYALAYTTCIGFFGWRRVRRRRTPYVRRQTLVLFLIQALPLFLLPYVVLPWLGHNGVFDHGAGRALADALFPESAWDEHGREYWRAVGFVLAWPLLPWNLFTAQPLWAWIAIGLAQTFWLIPWMVRKWGKGAYCGWICSCGALAETMGDAHRHKMPHGPGTNRLNLAGQAILALALLLLLLRVVGWILPGSSFESLYMAALFGKDVHWADLPGPLRFLNYAWFVDLFLAGAVGLGFYFWFSGRVWCRFFCPLAALMHVYARFSRFRILARKERCISCNVCTSVCHQGIDVMNFANKGLPMADPECVRCSACVASCPTGVLSFGEVDPRTGEVLRRDRLAASAFAVEGGEGGAAGGRVGRG